MHEGSPESNDWAKSTSTGRKAIQALVANSLFGACRFVYIPPHLHPPLLRASVTGPPQTPFFCSAPRPAHAKLLPHHSTTDAHDARPPLPCLLRTPKPTAPCLPPRRRRIAWIARTNTRVLIVTLAHRKAGRKSQDRREKMASAATAAARRGLLTYVASRGRPWLALASNHQPQQQQLRAYSEKKEWNDFVGESRNRTSNAVRTPPSTLFL